MGPREDSRISAPEGFRSNSAGDSQSGDPDAVTVGFAGALKAHKGPHLLLQALHDLGWTRTRVRVAGGGDREYEQHVRQLARGLNVEFAGRVDSQDMPAFLQSVDVLVIPSLWPENLPIVVLESYAVGTPMLASRVGGIAELVGDPQRLFDVDSASSLAACLKSWVESPLSERTLPRISTAEEMIEATISVYEECMQDSACP